MFFQRADGEYRKTAGRLEKHIRGEVLSENVQEFYTAINTYANAGDSEHAVWLMERLCSLSRQKNHIDSHRCIVVDLLMHYADYFPQALLPIAAGEESCFDGNISEEADRFCWICGYLCERTEDPAGAVRWFERCQTVRSQLYGPQSWMTAVAGREKTFVVWMASGDPSCIPQFIEFARNIENGEYPEADETAARFLEGKTLYLALKGTERTGIIENQEYWLERYEALCSRFAGAGDPMIQPRLACVLRGSYYFNTGRFMSAETAYKDALRTQLPSGVPEIITETGIRYNLLLTYVVQDDEAAWLLLQELLNDIRTFNITGRNSEDLTTGSICQILGLAATMWNEAGTEVPAEIRPYYYQQLDTLYLRTRSNSASLYEYPQETGAFAALGTRAFMIQDAKNSEPDERQARYLSMLDFFTRHEEQLPMTRFCRSTLYYVSAWLALNLNRDDAESYVQRCLSVVRSSSSGETVNDEHVLTAMLQLAAYYYSRTGRASQGDTLLKEAMKRLDQTWRPYVRYLNDARLIRALRSVEKQFEACYAMLRQTADTQTAYEGVLRFKQIASRAGRERNRVLRMQGDDLPDMKEIRLLQDRIAAMETQGLDPDEAPLAPAREELRRLEAGFEKNFTGWSRPVEVTWDRVRSSIPKGSAVIEYCFTAPEYGWSQTDPEIRYDAFGTGMCLDIYVYVNQGSRYTLTRFTADDGDEILKKSVDFVNILQAEAQGDECDEDELDEIRHYLYSCLIGEAAGLLREAATVYVAPDMQLFNVPIENLCRDYGEKTFGDEHTVIKIESARDFLYEEAGGSAPGGSIAIGGPKYDAGDKEIPDHGSESDGPHSGRPRESVMREEIRSMAPMHPLPFSSIEVRRVSRQTDGECYTGAEATKAMVLQAGRHRNIHLATHGFFDTEGMRDALYSSFLAFSGIDEWCVSGKTTARYGNGIVTADELSRLDMQGVELVVLSSCMVGLNNPTLTKGFNGMTSALAAAGVRYVISCLWSADDFATAILMDAFYYYYWRCQKEPPQALHVAKQYLRQVTVRQLREAGWMDLIDQNAELPESLKQEIHSLNDGIRLFSHEVYWGGFTCTRCN